MFVDRTGAKLMISEQYSRNSKGTYGLVLEQVANYDDTGALAPQGTKPMITGEFDANGPPTSLSGSGRDALGFLQGNFTRDTTYYENGMLLGGRDVFQASSPSSSDARHVLGYECSPLVQQCLGQAVLDRMGWRQCSCVPAGGPGLWAGLHKASVQSPSLLEHSLHPARKGRPGFQGATQGPGAARALRRLRGGPASLRPVHPGRPLLRAPLPLAALYVTPTLAIGACFCATRTRFWTSL